MHPSELSLNTDESNNQFMLNQSRDGMSHSNQSVEDYQKFMAMFQSMMKNPNNFMKAMMSQAQQAPHNQVMQSPHDQNMENSRFREFQVEQHKHRNHQVSPRRNIEPKNQVHMPRQKGHDVLSHYLPQQSRVDQADQQFVTGKSFQTDGYSQVQLSEDIHGLSKLNDDSHSLIRPNDDDRSLSRPYDQQPIKSQYIDEVQEEIKKSSSLTSPREYPESIAFDDRPLPTISANLQNNSVNRNQKDLITSPEFEERPIKGIKGDFKEFLRSQEGIDFPPDLHDTNSPEQSVVHENDHRESKPFLKRGSRQFLSSAKNKVAKKSRKQQNTRTQNDDLGSSGIRQAQKSNRSISPNRVLGGKKARHQKSINKPAQKSTHQSEHQQISPRQGNQSPTPQRKTGLASNVQRPKNEQSPKNVREVSVSPTFKHHSGSQGKSRKPMQNIFQGSSSDMSDEQDSSMQQSKPNQYSSQPIQSYSAQKIEVIKGVFLTKKQLHEIVTKYSQSAAASPSPEEGKLKELKKKYIDLCNVLAEEKAIFEETMEKERQEFEQKKMIELQKIKNERKVQERNFAVPRKDKEREQFELLRKQLEKEREEYRKKEKNNKILIQKYRKELEEARVKLATLEVPKKYEGAEKEEIMATNSLKKPSRKTSNCGRNQGQRQEEHQKWKQDEHHEKDQQDFKKTNANFYLPNYSDIRKNPTGDTLYQPSKQQSREAEFNNHGKAPKVLRNRNQSMDGDEQDSYNVSRTDSQSSDQRSGSAQIVEYSSSMRLSDLVKIPLSIKMVTAAMIDNLFRYQNNPEYQNYLELKSKPRTKIHTSRNAAEKKLTNIYADGGKQVIFETGVKKQYFNNGYSIVLFTNGDIKQKLSDGTVLYYYKEKNVDQITLTNNTNIYRFENNQVEFHSGDNVIEIRNPDGTFKAI